MGRTERGSRSIRRTESTLALSVGAYTPDLGSRAPGECLRARLATWLLRPYLDLGPFHTGPLHAGAVEEAWRAFSDPDTPPFVCQRALPSRIPGRAGR